MSLLHTPEYTKNLKRFEGARRQCANEACIAADGKRTWLRRSKDDDYCDKCLRNPKVDTSRKPVRRHGTGELDLVKLRDVARRKKMTYKQISLACANLGEEIGTHTLSQWGRGKSLAPKDEAITLTCVLDCTLEELTGE